MKVEGADFDHIESKRHSLSAQVAAVKLLVDQLRASRDVQGIVAPVLALRAAIKDLERSLASVSLTILAEETSADLRRPPDLRKARFEVFVPHAAPVADPPSLAEGRYLDFLCKRADDRVERLQRLVNTKPSSEYLQRDLESAVHSKREFDRRDTRADRLLVRIALSCRLDDALDKMDVSPLCECSAAL